MEQEYRKDLSHTTWEKVYERQRKRAEQAAEWLDGLELRPGDRVLDLGAGPGFVSIMAARRVGIRGVVYAVDRSSEALAYLAQQQEAQSVQQIRRIVADVAELELVDPQIKGALVTMMLHHDDNPAALLLRVAQVVPSGCRVAVAEFHPEGPCEYGAPREHRIHPDQAEAWCREAGLKPVAYKRQTPEHYMYILVRE